MFALTKEDYFRAAEIMSNTNSYSVDYTAQILAKIIPLTIIERMKPVLSPEEIERVVQEDGRSPEPENLKRLLEVLNIE